MNRRLLNVVVVLAVAGVTVGSLGPFAGENTVERSKAVPVRVELTDRDADLQRFGELGLDIDGVFGGWVRIYATPGQRDVLEGAGYSVTLLPDEGRIGLERLADEGVASGVVTAVPPTQYHTYATLTSDLQAIAAEYSDLTRLTSIGQSYQGRELWMMRITSDPDTVSTKPEVAYISSMHGDEVVGKELVFSLINYLTDNYGTDSRVTNLVDNTEIFIMPSMNPDGTELGQRYNAQGTDLNRDFPDLFFDPINTPDGRAVETGLIMAWTAQQSIVLSANFHGGALLANYPMDNNETGSSVFSPAPAPDHDTFYSISRSYADTNLPMYANHGGYLDHGVTNGAEWYAVTGGMQDWNYGWYGNFQVTIEVSNVKWPSAAQLPQFWNENLESMLAYLERVHEGVWGVVTDADTGLPVAATVRIDSNPYPAYTDPDAGDYHRVIVQPGSYQLEVSAVGYSTQVVPITVTAGASTRFDVAMQALDTDLQPAGNRVEDGVSGDGWLDPGETSDLAVTLHNLGRAATQVSATLEPTGWYTQVTRADAGFPDIATAQSGESQAPHFEVYVDPEIPAGHRAGFAIRWSTADASGVTEPFFLGVGGPWCQTVPATDVPQPIEDNQTTTSLLTVGSAMTLTEVRVPVDISHTYIGDLDIELTSPSSTPVVLHNRSGGPSSDIVGTYGENLTPAEPLSVLVGEASGGTWQLTVTDNAGSDQGTLNSWDLYLCEEPVEAATPQMRLGDVSADPAGVTVEWWSYPGLTSYRVYRATDPSAAGNFIDVTSEDGDNTDTRFLDTSTDAVVFYLVTGIGPQGEGPKGHFDE